MRNKWGRKAKCVARARNTDPFKATTVLCFYLPGSERQRMNRVRSTDAGGIHRHFCITHFLGGCCKKAALSSPTPARAGALLREGLLRAIMFYTVDQFYSSSFLMLSLGEETRLGSLGWHSRQNQLTQCCWESFIRDLTLYFFKGTVLTGLDPGVSYCFSCPDCQDLELYGPSSHLYPVEPFISC